MNSAKAPLFACFVCWLIISTGAEEPSTEVKVLGIINLPGWKRAVLQFPGGFRGRTAYTILAEGESDGQEISVSQIRPADGTVKGRLKNSEAFFEIPLRTNKTPSHVHSVDLDGVDLNTMLRLYSEWSKRTL